MTDTTLMPSIALAATHSTPEVHFDFAACRLMMKGEAYPENAAAFFRPLLEAVEAWLQDSAAAPRSVDVHVALSYFNSSSTKLLFELFDCLNRFAQAGKACHLHWYYDAEDDISEEFGQELKLDFPALNVTPIADLSAC
ncbi:DUF1987 domain-containing protein [Atlantibacter sp.]|uniref:DUF1987 domain-containing protein n=1 Tax=Atlantibacter sp. TaxID=1903473 RepID=UPI0028AEE538|nr:DUF1987 domain-containing protein [Atlantibacter sp.]